MPITLKFTVGDGKGRVALACPGCEREIIKTIDLWMKTKSVTCACGQVTLVKESARKHLIGSVKTAIDTE